MVISFCSGILIQYRCQRRVENLIGKKFLYRINIILRNFTYVLSMLHAYFMQISRAKAVPSSVLSFSKMLNFECLLSKSILLSNSATVLLSHQHFVFLFFFFFALTLTVSGS